MRVKYIDTLCTNGTHLMFNASLLAILKNIFNEIIVYGEKQNIKEQLLLLRENQIETHYIKVTNIWLPIAKSRFSNALLYICSFFYNLYFITTASRTDILVFNYNNMLAVRSMNFFNKFFKRKILIFCHGEMEYLVADTSFFGPFNNLLFKLGRQFFLNKKIKIDKNIKFVVLGESILKNIRKVVPSSIHNSFIMMDHSYFFSKAKKHEKNCSEKIKVGTVGLFYKMKGADQFCDLASKLKDENIEISITGKIFYDIKKLQKLNIDLPQNLGKDIVPRRELEKRVQELDIILYLYPTTSYKLIASGAILDAISMRKPIVALKNDYFSYIFDKFGAFGYLVDSVQEMAQILQNIKKEDLIFDFDTIQEKLSVDVISKELTKLLHQEEFI